MLSGDYRSAPAMPALSATGRRFAGCSLPTLAWLTALYLTLVFNSSLFQVLYHAHQSPLPQQILFMLSSVVITFAIALTVISVLAIRPLFKPWLVLLVASSSMASYFSMHYNVIIDRDMVDNILQTDWAETRELLTFPLLGYFSLTGLLPAILIMIVPVRYPPALMNLSLQIGTIALSLTLILGLAFSQYQDFASVFRNQRELRYLVVPSGPLYAFSSYIMKQLETGNKALTHLGQDAHLGKRWPQQAQRKNLLIIVVGETARAQNFSLGGYSRDTNPKLAEDDVIYFSNVQSCGTSTAVSVPCMFSPYGRDHYDESRIRHSENLLDVLHHAGLEVLWRDNNSGCKGVCDRIPYEDVSHLSDPRFCNEHECYDMVLLDQLETRFERLQDGGVVVLHQKGSHGPGYFLRSPQSLKRFGPECHSAELQQCSQAEIQNAYDNTIVYTDYVLDQLIRLLKRNEYRYNSALLYVSDHGESLSEGNMYLHGLPYRIAPDEQTHVPLLLWLSKHYAMQMGIDERCLRQQTEQPYSHDNLFDTVLDLVDVHSTLHHREKSMVSACMNPETRTADSGETDIDDSRQT